MLHDGLAQYSRIPAEEFQKLIRFATIRHLTKREHYLRAGDKPNNFGFVVSGILRLYYATEDGKEFNKSFCGEGDFVGAYSALLENRESRLTIQALTDTTLLLISYNGYVKLLEHHTCWQTLSRKLAEKLFIKKEQKESQFLIDSAEQRYHTFLKEFPGLEKRIRQHHIASYLGITPVALSRIRAKSKDR